LVNESLSRAAEAITGGNIRAYSDFFGRTDSQPYSSPIDGEGSLLCFTNGLLIRGYTLLDGSRPPMPVSLKVYVVKPIWTLADKILGGIFTISKVPFSQS